ncbi:unnamed protein product [Closterium sp. NIES-53]
MSKAWRGNIVLQVPARVVVEVVEPRRGGKRWGKGRRGRRKWGSGCREVGVRASETRGQRIASEPLHAVVARIATATATTTATATAQKKTRPYAEPGLGAASACAQSGGPIGWAEWSRRAGKAESEDRGAGLQCGGSAPPRGLGAARGRSAPCASGGGDDDW